MFWAFLVLKTKFGISSWKVGIIKIGVSDDFLLCKYTLLSEFKKINDQNPSQDEIIQMSPFFGIILQLIQILRSNIGFIK